MRHLVTTALEESWPEGTPIMMLGEWCRRFDRRDRWSRLDIAMAPPVGLTCAEKARDGAEVRRIVEALLPDIGAALDAYHGERHDTRYWRIVLGHWLIRYVSVVFNRYQAISAALAGGQLSGTTLLASNEYSLATTDSLAFIWASDDDLWNHVLYARVLDFMSRWQRHLPWRTVRARSEESRFVEDMQAVNRQGGALARIAPLAATVMRIFMRDSDAFFLNSYLPVRVRVRLELSLGQFPQVWRSAAAPQTAPDGDVRAVLRPLIPCEEPVEKLARELWREMIPASFVEGRRALVDRVGELPWPRQPRFVFTANAFDTDELFKIWVAGQVENGTPYFTGQHGNNYGTHKWWGASFWPERAASDRFLTWGWRSEDPRDVPALLLKTAGKSARSSGGTGGLLLIEVAIPHRVSPHDSDAEFAMYQEEQFRFVSALPTSIRGQITVRLHSEYRRHKWSEELRWAERASDVSLEKGSASIESLIDGNRLVVHSYDSTGILETLAMNVPTVCFWNGSLEHLLPSALPFYSKLQTVGILHLSPEAAADAVVRDWDHVANWWESPAVQETRVEFCDRFARSVPDPTGTLKTLLQL